MQKGKMVPEEALQTAEKKKCKTKEKKKDPKNSKER